MNRHSVATAGLAVWWALAAGAVGGVTEVVPEQGTLGDILTIAGTGFGAAKAKAYLEPGLGGKRVSLKVSAVTDTSITAVVSKGAAGVYDVVVVPAGGASERLVSGFELVAPVVQGLEPSVGMPGDSIVVHGAFFGPKPTVVIGGVRTKATAVTTDGLTVRVPTKLANGIYDVTVANKLGSGALPSGLTVTGSAVGVPTKDYFRATFGGQGMEVPAGPRLTGSWTRATKLLSFAAGDPPTSLSGQVRVFNITALVDLEDVLPALVDANPANPNHGLMTYQVTTLPGTIGGIPTSTTWLTRDTWEWTIAVNAFAGGRVVGSFSGIMRDGTTNAPLEVRGEFAVTLVVAK